MWLLIFSQIIVKSFFYILFEIFFFVRTVLKLNKFYQSSNFNLSTFYILEIPKGLKKMLSH